ncbi:MAG: glycosyltransferase family 4 protein [Candidatus Nomurabacteria bacterium]|nr:MAG: glycosyltransferase family 4 protein [Candidatus Nomurabacteria bacterium]
MRIGIDASRANTLHRTGTEWYSFFVIKELLEQDTKNSYVLYVKEPLVADMHYLAEKAEIRVLKWPPKFLWNLFRLSWEMFWNKPEILFVPAHTIPFIHPKKLITTIHDVGFERFPELYAQHPIGPKRGVLRYLFSFFVRLFSLGRYGNNELDYHRFSVRMALQHGGEILTVSNFSRDEICHFFPFPKERIRVIHNGLHPDYAKTYSEEEIAQTRHTYALPESYVFFIGRWEKKKNIDGLLRGFAQFQKENKDQHLVLIGKPGTGFDEAWAALDEETRKQIFLLERVHEEVPQIMAGARMLLFPSKYEGFGLPVLEAMALGVPVICSKFASLPEVAGNAAYYLRDDTPESIAQALKDVNGSSELREQLREKGFQQVKGFSWQKTGQQIRDLIEQM